MTLHQPHAGEAPGSRAGEETIVDLIRQFTRQGAHLAEQQMNLVQAEVREGVDDLKTGIVAMLGAAVVGMAGLGVLLMGLAYLLGDAIDNMPVATVIVGIVALVIAGILYAGASKKLRSSELAPERSRRTLERTPDAVRGDLHSEKHHA